MAAPEGAKTKDGFDVQFGTNHLGHFLLFQLLKPALLAASTPAFNSRVVSLSSLGNPEPFLAPSPSSIKPCSLSSIWKICVGFFAKSWLSQAIKKKLVKPSLLCLSVPTDFGMCSDRELWSFLEEPHWCLLVLSEPDLHIFASRQIHFASWSKHVRAL